MTGGATIARTRLTGGRRPRLWRCAGPAAALALLLAGPLSLTGCAEFVISAVTTTSLAMAEERTLGDAVEDLGIHAELNHLFFQDDLAPPSVPLADEGPGPRELGRPAGHRH